ncbi:hypothetical protein BCV69DRAFT_310593 [Microstroma glucosiphilum]|uniref:Large ribosomal subunit protein eL14 domain-containing protein n=1 Tax=Pseudomicrostroma glucosiphilum TaxID=1684307 RepID=A0A316UCZ2_9BASI|nr:hypothetical protein BCV69DRAFT_310593 [Pseudomicrostroma glucosiphilum]PWN23107.1 hypothetical protein BCV69DRAFT_310593 [Pseudomicrostroma glucosiphilum]
MSSHTTSRSRGIGIMLLQHIHHAGRRSLTSSASVARSAAQGQTPKVVLYTGTDCSLCDVVKATLEEVRKEIPYEVQYYNIRDDSLPDVHKYRRLYQYDIPVIHLNGQAKMSAAQEAFKRYVEVGRVVLINQGESEGKLAVIVEIVDHNKAIVDGPSTGVARQVIRYRYTTLTPFVVPGLPRGSGSTTVKKFFDKSDVNEKWAKSAWAKKRQAQKAKRETSDFDRFNIMLLKKQRRFLAQKAAAKQAKA